MSEDDWFVLMDSYFAGEIDFDSVLSVLDTSARARHSAPVLAQSLPTEPIAPPSKAQLMGRR